MWYQAIIWNNTVLSSIEHSEMYYSEILLDIETFK